MHFLRVAVLRQPAAAPRSRNRYRIRRTRKANRRRRRLAQSYRPSSGERPGSSTISKRCSSQKADCAKVSRHQRRQRFSVRRSMETVIPSRAQTQAAPIQQHPDQNKQRCDIKPATEEANRVRKGPAPTLEATATQAGPTGVLAQFRGQTPGGTRIIGAVQTTDPAVRTRLACPPRSKILVDPGQQMPDMTDGDGANRTGDKTQGSVGH